MTSPNGSAFPRKYKVAVQVEYDDSDAMFDDRGVRTEYHDRFDTGLTKREYFAIHILSGMPASTPNCVSESCAVFAVKEADALLHELERTKS